MQIYLYILLNFYFILFLKLCFSICITVVLFVQQIPIVNLSNKEEWELRIRRSLMKSVQCLTTRGAVAALPLIDPGTARLPSIFDAYLSAGGMLMRGSSPMPSVQPSMHFRVLGAVMQYDTPSLALHMAGLPGAVLCCEEELHELRRLLEACDVTGLAADNTTMASTILKAIGRYDAIGEYVSTFLEDLSIALTDDALSLQSVEEMFKVSDRLKRQRVKITTSFPYHCGSSNQAVKHYLCTDKAVCAQFIPSIEHGDKILCREGIATFVGIGDYDGDWVPFWHCAGASHASLWPAGDSGRRVVIGKSSLQHNGPTPSCRVGEAEDVGRYLHPTSREGGFDESKWLNEGLFGVGAGSIIGGYKVLGVAQHTLFPRSRLELYLKDLESQEIVPLSLTRGLAFL